MTSGTNAAVRASYASTSTRSSATSTDVVLVTAAAVDEMERALGV